MTSPTYEQNEPLQAWLADRIKAEGPITVAEFMAQALYHPQFGYYTKGPNIGPRGDFVTSPEASPAFGRLLAVHLADIDRLLGSPAVFDVVEAGPGRGTLARDLLDELQSTNPVLYTRLRYHLVEISPALTETQKVVLIPAHKGVADWSSSLAQLPYGLQGAAIGNELVDAFPVNVVENKDGVLLEQFVGLDKEGKLALELAPVSNRALLAFLENEGVKLEPGERVEINLSIDSWMLDLASKLERGVVTLIDYGDEAPARYSPARREGTLLGYYAGGVTSSIVLHPGEQDLTALVDFTALKHSAERAGFKLLDITRQASFLLGLGLGTTHTAESVSGDNVEAALQYRRGLQSLISMEGLGRFHVLLLGRGIEGADAHGTLSGLKYARYLA
jgi:SAM-dependent MidA family methyltransferase